MNTKSFATDLNGAKRVDVHWQFGWTDFEIFVDGVLFARARDREEMKRGIALKAADGHELQLCFTSRWLSPTLVLLRDRVPVPQPKPVSHYANLPPEPTRSDEDIVDSAKLSLYVIGCLTSIMLTVGALMAPSSDVWSACVAFAATAGFYVVTAWTIGRWPRVGMLSAALLFALGTLASFGSPSFFLPLSAMVYALPAAWRLQRRLNDERQTVQRGKTSTVR